MFILLILIIFSSCATLNPDRGETGYARRTFVDINGFPMYLDIRGKSQEKPILLVLHGGPGWPIDTLFQSILQELEEYFLIVNWHQRGAGRSYYRDIPENQMNLQVFLSDTERLIYYILDYYSQEKLFLLGHSWGTVLGTITAARHPELLYAYIGISQLTNTLNMLTESKKSAVRSAYDQGRASIARDIDRLNPADLEKNWYRDAILYRDYLTKIEGTVYGSTSYYYFVRHYLKDVSYKWGEKIDIIDGLGFSIYSLYPYMLKADLNREAPKIDVPVFIMQGAYDLLTLPELAKSFLDTLDAPLKGFYLFTESAHSPLFEEPGKFIRIMSRDILPLAGKKYIPLYLSLLDVKDGLPAPLNKAVFFIPPPFPGYQDREAVSYPSLP